MSVCITESAGTVVIDTATVPCANFVMLDTAEYQALIESPSLADIFQVPIASDMGQAWQIGFSLPIILYLTAWALGVVVNFINSK